MAAVQSPPGLLTATEYRVLQAFSYGQTREGTATILGLTVGSVAGVEKEVRRKLRAKNMAQAIANAMRAGLLS